MPSLSMFSATTRGRGLRNSSAHRQRKPRRHAGRGERAEVIVGWVWPAEGAAHAAATLVRARIAGIPGVDEVSDPELDLQFRLIWSVRAIIRVTQ